RTAGDFFASGKKFYDAKKYDEAAIQFLKALQKDPKNRDARYLLALTYKTQREWGRAAQQLRALLEYRDGDLDASMELANIYVGGGLREKDLFRQAQELAQK